jgi:uncharacterized membrane protein YbhN (UPF0104 family)
VIATLLDRAGDVADRFAALDGRFLLPALALQLANLALRSLAWRNVLAAAHPGRRVAYSSIAGAYVAGVGLNTFLPGRAGEAAKVVLARARIAGSNIATVGAALSVVLLFDALFGASLLATLWGLGVAPGLPSPPAAGPFVLVVVGAVTAAAVAAIAFRPERVRQLVVRAAAGGAVLRTPRRYVRQVAVFQLAAWACRIGVVLLVLAAFGIQPSVGTAAVVLVVGGLSTAVPVPGGGGTQQVLVAYALHSTASISQSVAFSVGMQAGVALVNTAAGVAALMVMFRAVTPATAVRSAVAAVRRP